MHCMEIRLYGLVVYIVDGVRERQSIFLASNVPSSDVSMYVCVIPLASITRWAVCGREERREESDG